MIISVPQYSVFQNYSSYLEYPWSYIGRYASERFEIRLQFKVDLNKTNSLENGLMVFLGQSTIGKYQNNTAEGV